jgi:hypothetical protein
MTLLVCQGEEWERAANLGDKTQDRKDRNGWPAGAEGDNHKGETEGLAPAANPAACHSGILHPTVRAFRY